MSIKSCLAMLQGDLWLKLAFANVVNFINTTDSDFSKEAILIEW